MKGTRWIAGLVLLGGLVSAAFATPACKPEYGEARYQDADGSTALFAGQPFVVKRQKDGKVLYRGKIDASGVARWRAGCKGEALIIQ